MISRGLFCIACQVLLFQTAFSLQTFLTSPLLYGSAYLDSSGIAVHAGWNIISLPLQPPDQSSATLFPTATSPVWSYNGGYRSVDTLRQGVGYWMKFAADDTMMVRGSRRFEFKTPLGPRWNLVAPLNVPVRTDSLHVEPAGRVLSPWFRFVSGAGYETSATLIPGEGYWVKLSDSATLTVRSDLQFSYSRDDSVEAREIALWYGGTIVPSESLTTIFLRDLKYLRDRFHNVVLQETVHVVSALRFEAPWKPSYVEIKFDDSTARLVRDGVYNGWQQLEARYRPTFWSLPDSTSNWSHATCEEVLHSRRLAELYSQLPGVTWAAETLYLWDWETTFPILIRKEGDGFRYVFTLGNELDYGPHWSFTTATGVPEYLGRRSWDDPPPPWWISSFELKVEFLEWDGP